MLGMLSLPRDLVQRLLPAKHGVAHKQKDENVCDTKDLQEEDWGATWIVFRIDRQWI